MEVEKELEQYRQEAQKLGVSGPTLRAQAAHPRGLHPLAVLLRAPASAEGARTVVEGRHIGDVEPEEMDAAVRASQRCREADVGAGLDLL